MAVLNARANALPTKTLGTTVRLALLLLAVARLTACFSPAQPGCAFSCTGDRICPSGYSCGNDLICHRDDGQGSCSIQTDAATDALTSKTDATSDTKTEIEADATSGP